MSQNQNRMKPRAKKGTLLRVIRLLYSSYPVLMPLVTVASICTAIVSSIPALFQQKIIEIIEVYFIDATTLSVPASVLKAAWEKAFPEILGNVIPLACCYVISLLLLILNT